MDSETKTETTPVTPAPVSPTISAAPTTPVAPPPTLTPDTITPPSQKTFAEKINHIMATVLIISAVSFVLIALLAIWNVFGDDAGTVVWRSLGSLGAIALGALIVSVASKLVITHQK